MHLLILSQYFYPELISTGQILTELAEDLFKRGYSISVVAGQPTYYDNSRVEREIIHEGIHISRVNNTQFDKNTIRGKIINSATFFFWSLKKAFSASSEYIVLVVTNPPFLPLAAYFLSIVRNQKYVCIIHDVYPDMAIRLGYLRPGVVERVWNYINRLIWEKSDAIIVLGRDMEEKIQSKLNPSYWDKIHFIPNWSDGEAIVPLNKKDNSFLEEIGISPTEFVVQYSGNMGLFHDMETIIEAAAKLQNLPITFLFIGGGGKKAKIEDMARSSGLKNIVFVPYQPKEKLRYSLSCSDVSIVCLEKGVEGLAVPCKFYGILASGRPVIALMDDHSEIAMAIREARCGFVLRQGDADALAEKIQYFFLHPETVSEMGKRSRAFFDGNYSRKIISQKYFSMLEKIGT